jgi:iron(III) transport system ATP-binding protein
LSSTITIRNLVKRYDGAAPGQNAVDGVSADIGEGELVTLLGPSGCGKTTTLRMIAGLEQPTSGEISFGETPIFSDALGVEMPIHRRPIGMVFQSYAIWPHMNVFENVAFPLRVGGERLHVREVRARTEAALEKVGLSGFSSRASTDLSGGQQQRVALARALVRRPQILLLDEPLSNLDAKLREQMRDEIRELQQRTRITTVFVTHDQAEALAVSDRILVMNAGRIVEDGAPRDIYRDPSDEFTADFIGVANKLVGRAIRVEPHCVVAQTPLGEIAFVASGSRFTKGQDVCAFIRPECLSLMSGHRDGPWRGTITRIVFQGDHTDYLVDVRDARLRVRSYGEQTLFSLGEKVSVSPDLARIRLHSFGGPTESSAERNLDLASLVRSEVMNS